MSTKYATSLRLDFQPSRFFLRLAVSIHALALIASLATALPLPVHIILAIAVIASLLHSIQNHHRYSRPIELHYSAQSGWSLHDGALATKIELLYSTFISRWVIALHYRTQAKRSQQLWIYFDAIPTEQYRQLKVLLRIVAMS